VIKFDPEHHVSLKSILLLFVGWTGALLVLTKTVTQIDDILLPDTSLKYM